MKNSTILLTESGDLEVYEGKRPEETIAVQDIDCCGNPTKYGSCCGNGIPVWKEEPNPDFYKWLSTKKVVKMADGELNKVRVYIDENIEAWSPSKVYDVSDIVTLKPTHKTPTDHFLGHLGEMELQGYFTPPPVDKEEETPDKYYPGHQYQELFNHMINEHGLILVESQMQEIIRIVESIQKKWIKQNIL